MPVKRRIIYLSVNGNSLLATDAQTNNVCTDAGVQGEDSAVWLHIDIPTDWQDLSCILQVVAANGNFDVSGVPVSNSIDMPLRQGVTVAGQLIISLIGTTSGGLRETAGCRTLTISQSIICVNQIINQNPTLLDQVISNANDALTSAEQAEASAASIPSISGDWGTARGTFPTVTGRLNNSDTALNVTNSNVASNAVAIASVASGSPKAVYPTVSALQAAIPTGNTNIYLVLGTNGTQEVDTITVTGAPTAIGNVVITLNGVPVNISVTSGVAEIASLAVTAACGSSSNATVTLNGTGTTVALDSTTDTTATLVATKIRAATFTGWTTGGTDTTVTFTSTTVGVKTDATYSAGTTGATGTMTTTTQGVAADTTTTTATKIRAGTFTGWLASGTGTAVIFTKNTVGTNTPVVFGAGATGVTATFVLTTSGVASTTSDWYFWNGSTWVDGGVYQSTGIPNNSLTGLQIKGYKTGKNLINKNIITAGKYLAWSSGGIGNGSGHNITEYIPLTPLTSYIQTSCIIVCFYDAGKTYISGIQFPTTFTTPANTAYCLLQIEDGGSINTAQLELGTATTPYEAYKTVLDLTGTNIDFRPAPKTITASDIKDDSLTDNLLQAASMSANSTNFLRERHINIYNTLATRTAGYFYSDGIIHASGAHQTTDFMPCLYGRTYKVQVSSLNAAFFDVNKVFISFIDLTYTSIAVPNNPAIYYMRYSANNSNIDVNMMCVLDVMPSVFVPYANTVLEWTTDQYKTNMNTPVSKLKGLKWNSIGDSIANWADGYKALIPSMTGVIMQNYAQNGASYATPGLPSFPNINLIWQNMTNDADIITVHAGVNDKASATPIGVMTDRVNTTFFGALHIVLAGLVEKYPGKKIGVITPTQIEVNADLVAYISAEIQVAKFYGIPVLDLNSVCGLYPAIPAIKTAFYNEVSPTAALHPTQAGHKVFINRIISFLESL